jgi:hypothetical protein
VPFAATHALAVVLVWTVVCIALGVFMIRSHRSHLHRRLPWLLIAPYLAVKWFLIALGGAGVVWIYIDHTGSVTRGVGLIALIALGGVWRGLSGHPRPPGSS